MTKLAQSWSGFAVLMLVFTALFGVAARNYALRYSLPPLAACGIYAAFITQLLFALTPAFAVVRSMAARWLERWSIRWALTGLWCLPYCLYAVGTGDWRWSALGRLLAVGIAVLAVYMAFPVGDTARFAWQDAVVAVLLIAAVLSRLLHGIWKVPVNLDFLTRLYLVSVAGWTWTFVRTVPQLGYALRISGRTLRAAAMNFLLFALIVIPLGLWLKFTAWNPKWQGPGAFAMDFVEIFLFIALLEEMFFRGFLQSLLSESFQSWWKAQAFVAVLFGFFHILHSPFPNWKYVLLATVAGWFYGSAFRTGGGLMASALVHATVDTVWRTFFTR